MGFRKKRNDYKSRRYANRSTKRRLSLRPPKHPGRIIAVVLAAVAVIVLALVWGSILKRQSDAFRDAESRGEWMLDTTITSPIVLDVPDAYRATAILPRGDVGDILIAGKHQGILLPYRGSDGAPLFASAVAQSAGMTVSPSAPDLTDEVTRITRRDLRLTCTFTVTFPSETDPAVRAYRRGLELSLLLECAEAAPNDLLLFGLPAGNDDLDALSVAFLEDLTELLSSLPNPPAIGVALPPSSFETDAADLYEDGPLYAGNVSPGRIAHAASYLALDLRGQDAATLEALLPHLSYTYLRHSLYLITDKALPEATDAAIRHGFLRVMEVS